MMVKNKWVSSNIQQSWFENTAWLRLIEYLKQENIHMKNHLSEMMDHVHGREQVALAEHFQNQFIIKDDVYDHMMHELKLQSGKWRENKWDVSSPKSADLQKNHNHIKEQMGKIRQEHLVLSDDYNTYLSSLTN
jgi:hypothetical protein